MLRQVLRYDSWYDGSVAWGLWRQATRDGGMSASDTSHEQQGIRPPAMDLMARHAMLYGHSGPVQQVGG
jgi:hypothetical protein